MNNCQTFDDGSDCTSGRECKSEYCLHGVCRTEAEYIAIYTIITAFALLIVAVAAYFAVRYLRNKYRGDKGAVYASQLYAERAAETGGQNERLVSP